MTHSMPRINLLGRAALYRLRQRRRMQRQGALAIGLGGLVAVAWLAGQHDQLAQQRETNAARAREVAQLALSAKEVAALRLALQAGTQRLAALQSLDQQRHSVAQSWVDLTRSLPPGVRFKHLKQEGDTWLVMGTAASGQQLTALIALWTEPDRAWRRAELVNVASQSSPASAKPSADTLATSATAATDELEFSIRLLRQPAPGTP